MKARHVQGESNDARTVLKNMEAAIDQDFHTLTSSQVEVVLAEADRVHYRKPLNANGSRARYFYERLQRLARHE